MRRAISLLLTFKLTYFWSAFELWKLTLETVFCAHLSVYCAASNQDTFVVSDVS